MLQLPIERTKRNNLPAMWERGGSHGERGHATIICNQFGKKPRAIFVRQTGELACKKHAMVVIKPKYYVILASHNCGNFRIEVYRIEYVPSPDSEDTHVDVSPVCQLDNGEWISLDDDRIATEVPEELKSAVYTAQRKAETIGCERPVWVQTDCTRRSHGWNSEDFQESRPDNYDDDWRRDDD